jgi:DNA-binding CsgD family transcriptional regulator
MSYQHTDAAIRRLHAIPIGASPETVFSLLRDYAGVAACLYESFTETDASPSVIPWQVPPDCLGPMLNFADPYARVVLQLMFNAPEGFTARQSDALPVQILEEYAVFSSLRKAGLHSSTGYKVIGERNEYRCHVGFFTIFTENKTISDENESLLQTIHPHVKDAMLRLSVPLNTANPILGQIIDDQKSGYICTSTNGSILEANERAFLIAFRYCPNGPPNKAIETLLDAIAKALGKSKSSLVSIPLPTGAPIRVTVHQLKKSLHGVSQDTQLVMLQHEDLPSRLEEVIGVLSPRRRELARLLITTNLSLKEIATRMNATEGTARTQRQQVYRTLGVNSRTELLHLAHQ